MSLLPGKPSVGMPSGVRLGPYEIVSFLGAGGMGEVYRARDTRLARTVAIKILPAHVSANADLKARFQHEARLISGLQHPNICVLYDIGSQDGIDFLVMEYLEGETLQAALERGPIPVEQVLEIGIQIGGALEKAHRQGIIHRDVKPGNIMLTPAGMKLMDFGLAKMQAFVAGNPAGLAAVATMSGSDSPLTLAGTVVGTVQYMSPEQIQGKELDRRSDVFSLGAVLYEALTGVRPAGGSSMLEIASNVLHSEPVRPSRLNANVGRKLESVVLKALAKECDQRYPSAQEFVDDLCAVRQLEAGRAGGSGTDRKLQSAVNLGSRAFGNLSQALRRPRIPVSYILAGVLLAVAAIWLGLRLARPGIHQPPAEAQHWYEVGTGALRDGAYYQASKALERAIAADEGFLLAHARLSEALVELDRADRAKDELLRVANTGRSALSGIDALYLDAVTAAARHDFGKAIELYRQIAEQSSATEKPYVLVDLGRAYEKNEEPTKAMEAYRQAADQNSQYATAFLHLGILYGRQHQVDQALESFSKADAIYQALGRLEGRAEVLYQRGSLFNQLSRLPEARENLEQALKLARAGDNGYQEIKTLLQLSSVAGDAGQIEQGKQYARTAVDLAQKTGMENMTSRGLVDLGNLSMISAQYGEAEKYYGQALDVAQRSKSPRNEARARMSLASLRQQQSRADEVVQYLEPALAYYRQGGYRTETAQGLGLLARADRQKGDYASALKANQELLRVAQQGKDASEIAFAQSELGESLSLLERYPEALDQLDRAHDAYKSLGAQRDLAYNQLSRGNYLLQLGRFRESQLAFDDALALAERGGYAEVSSQVSLARVQAALIQNQFSETKVRAGKVLAAADAGHLLAALEAKRALALAQVRSGAMTSGKATGSQALEMARRLKDPGRVAQTELAAAETMLLAGDAEGAFTAAQQAHAFFDRTGLKASAWRALLLAGLASRNGVDRAKSREYGSQAMESLLGLRQLWGPDAFASYLARPDVQRLRKNLTQLTGSGEFQSSAK